MINQRVSVVPLLLAVLQQSRIATSFSPIANSFASKPNLSHNHQRQVLKMSSTSTASSSWSDLQSLSASQSVGASLNKEAELRESGKGAPFVQSKLRLFDSEKTKLTLYR